MGIKNIPESYTELAKFKLDYEELTFHYTEDNHRVGTYTLELFCSWFPEAMHPAVRRGVYALMDDRMARAFGFPTGSPTVQRLAEIALRAKARAVRLMPTRKRSKSTDDGKNRTYPGYPANYRPRDLGALADPPRCPFPTAGSSSTDSAEGVLRPRAERTAEL